MLIKKFDRGCSKFSRKNKYRSSPNYSAFFLETFTLGPCLPRPFSTGAPRKSFDQVGHESKRQKINEHLQNHTPTKVTASAMKIFEKQHPKLENLIEYMTENEITPAEIVDIVSWRKALKAKTPIQSLSFMIKNDLSKHQYMSIATESKKFGLNLYAPYYKVAKAKLDCVPPLFTCTDCYFQVDPLESVGFSAKRTLESLKLQINPESNDGVIVSIKIGIDGARSGTHYSHHFTNMDLSDENFVISTYVILDIKTASGQILFQNDKPCSEKNTRPLFFSFEPETPELIQKVIADIKDSLYGTSSIEVYVNGDVFELNFCVQYEITMIDGKVSNALLFNNATLRCPVCLLTSKDFENIAPGTYSNESNVNRYKISLNSLHSTFKLFEFLLKIVQNREKYNFLLLNPQASKIEINQVVKIAKKNYEEMFWLELKAAIDYIKPGYGSSTTGPNVQRALKDPQKCAQILDIDLQFVETIFNLCNLLRSKSKPEKSVWMKNVKFAYKHYKENYSHFCSLTPSIHKIFVHGWEIINHFEYGPGTYSEESQEAMNKVFRKVRLNHARKTSLKDMIYDIFVYFYCFTDPIVNFE